MFWYVSFLAERYYATFGLLHRPSVRPSVCLLSVCLLLPVTFMHPTHRVELFGNIFAPPNSLGTRTAYLKLLERIRRDCKWPCNLNGKGYEKLAFLDQYLALSQQLHYNGKRIGTSMRSIEWCHFQWTWVSHNVDFKVMILYFVTSSNSNMVHGA